MNNRIETHQPTQPNKGQRWPIETRGSGLRNLLFVVLVGVAMALAVGSLAAAAPNEPAGALFGCPEELGPMVIANVDCTLGVAGAFDEADTALVVLSDVTPTVEPGRAPWCTAVADLTIYGCAASRQDPGRDGAGVASEAKVGR